MRPLFFLLSLLIAYINCLDLNEYTDNYEFPSSWHFFENHNSLENYKYGFLLESLLKFDTKFIKNIKLQKLAILNIELDSLELNEKIFQLISFPKLLIKKELNSKSFNNTELFKLCQPSLKTDLKKVKTKLYITTLELSNGKLLRLVTSFKNSGIWIWKKEDILIEKTSNNKYLDITNNRNNNNCHAIGVRDNLEITLKDISSNFENLDLKVEIPIIRAKFSSSILTEFLMKNELNGIISVGNLENFYFSGNLNIDKNFIETISKKLEYHIADYSIYLKCNEANKDNRKNILFLSARENYDLVSKNSLDLNRVKDAYIDLLFDNLSKLHSRIKINFDLNFYGIMIPEFRFRQFYYLMESLATKKNYSCEVAHNFLGKYIFCDCNFFNNQIEMKITESNIKSYVFHLKYFVSKYESLTTKKGVIENKCKLEVYGRRTKNNLFNENWIFGQGLCNLDGIDKIGISKNSNIWYINNSIYSNKSYFLLNLLTNISNNKSNSSKYLSILDSFFWKIKSAFFVILSFFLIYFGFSRFYYFVKLNLQRRISTNRATARMNNINSPIIVSTTRRIHSNESLSNNVHNNANMN